MMNLTVAEALGIYPLSEGKLIAGEQGVSRMLRSVNVMDAPDIANWIKDGEMVFTTAFIIKDRPGDVIHLLHKLNERGSAGMGIKLGRFWPKIPEEIIKEADRLQFPLIELPYQFTFSDQMNALFRAEFQRNTQILKDILEKQKLLMQLAFKKEKDMNIFRLLADILGYPIAVIGSRGYVLFDNTALGESRLLKGWPWKTDVYWINSGNGHFYRIPLLEQDECYGYLLIAPKSCCSVKAEEELFQQAAEMLSFQIGRKNYQTDLECSLQNDPGTLLIRYLQKKISLDYLLESAQKCGLSFLSGPYQCVLTTIFAHEDSARTKTILIKVGQELQYHPKLQKLKGHHFVIDEGLFSIYSAHPQQSNRRNELAHLLSEHFSADALSKDGVSPRFFISKIKQEPGVLHEAFQECLDTKHLAERFGLNEMVLQFDTVEFAYLFQHIPGEVMRSFCDKALYPLLGKDDYSQEMIRTLEIYLENDGQVNEAAKQLYIHRNTVAYRLEKIRDLLQVDFKKVNDLLRLRLAFMFRHFLECATKK